MLYPKNGDRIATIDSNVTSLHPMYIVFVANAVYGV